MRVQEDSEDDFFQGLLGEKFVDFWEGIRWVSSNESMTKDMDLSQCKMADQFCSLKIYYRDFGFKTAFTGTGQGRSQYLKIGSAC